MGSFDLRDTIIPFSLLQITNHFRQMDPGEVLEVIGDDESIAADLKSLLPEYRKNPELVVQRIYLDAIDAVLANADEKIVVEPSDISALRELRILLNRDLQLKRRAATQPQTQAPPDQP